MRVQDLKSEVSDRVIDEEGVTAVGVGEDENGNDVVVVNVDNEKSDIFVLPEEFEDEDIEIRTNGPFEPEIYRAGEPLAIDRMGKQRPVVGGVSAGHVDVTAGTAGYVIEDTDGNQYPTSNNHVYADVNNASQGDTIIQPGSADGGTTDDKSGELAGYVVIEDGAVLDFAWIDSTVEHSLEIAELGEPQGSPTEVAVGDTLIKSGRTTGVSESTVDQTSANVNVNYGETSYTINDCIITGDMSDGGDSGSATLKKSTMEPAGVLFAGSDTATVHSKATNIEPETGLSVVTADVDTTPAANVTITLIEQTSDTGDIIVTVGDGTGSAVGSATVSISGPVNDSGTTDATGVVSFTGVDIGDYTIEGSKDGYDPESATVSSTDFN